MIGDRTSASLLLMLFFCISGYAQGLHFRGMEYPIDERTSMKIRMHESFTDTLRIDFDAAFTREEDTGYLFRFGRGADEARPGGICLFFDSMSPSYLFRIIWEGHRFVSSLEIPKTEFPNSQWMHIRFKAVPKADSLYLKVGPHETAGSLELEDKICPHLNFGKNEYRIDVPSFHLRNLSITLDGRTFAFPLNEDSGNSAASNSPLVRGRVTNPEWLSQESFRWKKSFRYASDTFLTCGFDPAHHEVYLIARDSLILYPIGRGSPSVRKTLGENPVRTFLGASFADPSGAGYYCYEVYYGEARGADGPTVSYLDRDSLTWKAVSRRQFPTQLHHHSQLTDTLRRRFLIYGGFGNRQYNPSFYGFSLDSLSWGAAEAITGAEVWPRYFASMGMDREADRIYLFGGMGNESGDQIVGRQYLYDLYQIDPVSFAAKPCWTLRPGRTGRVPVRNMVLPGDGYFYTLFYPESLTETALTLYRFSLRDGQAARFADPIPMNSDRILSNANLYYDPVLEKLVAVIEETPDDRASTVTVYTLTFPPTARGLSTSARRRLRAGGIFGLLFLLLAALLYRNLHRTVRHRQLRARIPVTAIESPRPGPDSMLLFGGFVVIDSAGQDISSVFTEKIRQLFCVILFGGDNGVSSKRIRALLWPDKEEDRAKNLRGVTMNKLRKALSRLKGVSVHFEDNHFRLITGPPFFCDYIEFHRILESGIQDRDALIRLLSKGKFLLGESDPIFDPVKEEVEQRVNPVMQSEMKRRFELREYQNAILCADILFYTDPLDEDALACKVRSLRLLSREDEARSCYHAFISQYRKEYGEDYGVSFEAIVGQP